jgi:hypothetical protein
MELTDNRHLHRGRLYNFELAWETVNLDYGANMADVVFCSVRSKFQLDS